MHPVYLESRPGASFGRSGECGTFIPFKVEDSERSSQRADRCRVFGVDVPQTHPKRSAKGIAGCCLCCLPDVALRSMRPLAQSAEEVQGPLEHGLDKEPLGREFCRPV